MALGRAVGRRHSGILRQSRSRRAPHRRWPLLQAAREVVLLVRLPAGVRQRYEEGRGDVGETPIEPQCHEGACTV